MISHVELLDEAGNRLTHAGRTLNGRRLQFSVSEGSVGDVYRVEVLGDPTTGPPKEIPQLVAGVRNGAESQVMSVELEGTAYRDYDISIYRLTKNAAEEDVNQDAALEHRQTISVLQ